MNFFFYIFMLGLWSNLKTRRTALTGLNQKGAVMQLCKNGKRFELG